jgi:2'-5' RNA ligase
MAPVRTFVAVVPPPSALAPLVRAVEPLRASYAASWVPEERLHVTLAFLGEVGEEEAARVAGTLREAAAVREPFALRLSGGGAFPNPRRARVLWAGLDGDLAALASLAEVVRTDDTPFVPHVTVARLRRGGDVTDAVRALAPLTSEEWLVDEVALMRSRLGPAPSYEPLARCPLGYQA